MAATQFHMPLVGEEVDDPCTNILNPQSRSFQMEAGDTEARVQGHKANGRIRFALALAAVGLLVCAGAFSLDRSATKGVRGTSATQQLNAKADNAPTPRPKDVPEHGKKEVDPYVVVAIYSGRVERMRLLLPYLNRLRADGKIHEIHIWDFCKYDKDRAWIVMTAWQNNYTVQNYMGGRVLSRVFDYYADFERPGKGQMVILKVDDDIVYLDMETFGDFTRFTANHPEMLVVQANVVNNGVAAYYQFSHQPALQGSPLAAPLTVYPNEPDEGNGGILTKYNHLVAELHEKFLQDPAAFRWGDSNSCIEFRKPNSTTQGRFSINFFAARQEAWATLKKFVNEANGDDEPAVTTAATANNYKECMFTSFNAVHMSFGLQYEANVYGPRYEQLLERQGLRALPGLDDVDPCAAPEGDHSTVLEALRADHGGDDLPDMPLKGIDIAACKALCNAAVSCQGIEFVFEMDTDTECHMKANATANAVTDPYHCLWIKPASRL